MQEVQHQSHDHLALPLFLHLVHLLDHHLLDHDHLRNPTLVRNKVDQTTKIVRRREHNRVRDGRTERERWRRKRKGKKKRKKKKREKKRRKKRGGADERTEQVHLVLYK